MLLLTAVSCAADMLENSTPNAVVRALYRHSLDHFSFDRESVRAVKPWVTPGLYARLLKKVNTPQPKDEAPDIEGDVFLDAQEAPTGFKVDPGTIIIDETQAQVGVSLEWPGDKRHYTVFLQHLNGVWKVSEVQFEKDGRLTDLLR